MHLRLLLYLVLPRAHLRYVVLVVALALSETKVEIVYVVLLLEKRKVVDAVLAAPQPER